MISRIAPILVLLAACGAGGVCAGCGGDDDPGAIPPHFRVTSESKDFDCDGTAGVTRIAITNADTDVPIFENAPQGYDTCDAAADNGDSWTFHCQRNTVPVTWFHEVTLFKSLDSGTVTKHSDGVSIGDCTVTGAIVTVEIL